MVKSPLSPERITKTNNKNLEGALKFVSGGSPLGSSVVSSAANKIVGFNRAKVSPKQTNFKSLIDTLTSNIFNNISSVQNVFNNKTEKKEKGMSFFSGIFDKVKEALGFVRFFGEKKNLDKIKNSLNNLKDTFGETFEVAKALRKAIVKIFKELSGINASGGGGGLGNILSAIGGLLGGLIPGRKGARELPRGARALEGEGNMFSKIPKMMKGGGGGIGKLLLGGGLAAGGMALSGLSAGPGDTEFQPGETPTEVPGDLLDKFNSILDRFDKVLDGLMKGGKAPKGPGSSTKSSGSGTTPPGTTPPGPMPNPYDIPGLKVKPGSIGSLDQFKKALKGTPMEAEAEAVYNTALAEGINPAFVAGLAGAESSFGSKGKAVGRNNPYNYGVHDNQTYSSYAEATQALARGLRDPKGYYKGKKTLSDIISTYAPSSENDVTQHIKNIMSIGSRVGDANAVFIPRGTKGGTIVPVPVQTTTQIQTQGLSVQRGQGKSSVVVLPGAQQQTSTQQSGGGQLVAPPSPAKSGPQMPRLLTSNPDNFLNLYSKMVYNIIDG
jgi:hypothetical protein